MNDPQPQRRSGTGQRSATVERRGELHTALIAATEKIIAADGIDAVKARALATSVGCSVGAIYNVVPDLDALILAANARTLAAIDASLQTVSLDAADSLSAGSRLALLGLGYLAYAADHPRRWSALFAHRMASGNPVPQWYLAQQATMFGQVEGPLAALRPDLPPAERALLARSVFSAVHGVVSLGLSGTLVSVPLEVQKMQLVVIVEAMARGLAAMA